MRMLHDPCLSLASPFTFFIFLFSASPALDGENVEARDSLPILNLPYVSYKATSHSSASDIEYGYTFKNIRYAAPPSGIQDGSVGHSCTQAAPNGLNLLGTGDRSPAGAAINQLSDYHRKPWGDLLTYFSGGSEDYLFLDIWYVRSIRSIENVPGKALKNPSQSLPVVVFIYGDVYVFGSKDSLQPQLPFYDGIGLVTQSGNNMIFVSMNYRVWAYGFLAGTTMEKQGLPNAGLWDQARDYISLVGGDPTRVTAMGQSAGGGSIMHHLVAGGGKLDPLFSKAIFAFACSRVQYKRRLNLSLNWQAVLARAFHVSGRADTSTLADANTALMKQQYPGTSAVGPAPDGSYIRQLPVLELSTGNFWNIHSLILSHSTAQSNVFVDDLVQTDSDFTRFVNAIFPNYTQVAGVTGKVDDFYAVSGQSQYKLQTDRVQALLRDSSFTCNVRCPTESIGDSKVWNLQYGMSPGWHETDLLPTFFNSKFTGNSWLDNLAALMTQGSGQNEKTAGDFWKDAAAGGNKPWGIFATWCGGATTAASSGCTRSECEL
ncbi:alpha/beta-hydrolase [Hypoxylon sp. FL0890]|nr:alpha/beta-hydrolase [Hypoxylon sp. FL0890]